ncbi:gephyrin-like molybdotransferase receptor GlpR [Actinomycetospora sp. TBRC 11914]|uniref:divisome protein SepX/GlpR n=1 Tax=Actinomycetospora sp. TBRC 11914 TaxID=2729387 RepID=UPI00145E6AE8|nr:gephyrin-like molybdotransferase receptor GlpR [Actinomycetospora sp. TBRC 11914]NMO90846.1 hypothetical protein [Actinomycetospora sp. TBRC 11914]
MPSSLVFAALVVAWLAVLVPVVARRRQMVPRPAEAHLSSRVLARPERSTTTTATATTAEPEPETDTDTAPDDTGDTTGRTGDAPQGRVLERRRPRGPVRDDAGEDEGMDDHDDEGRLATAHHDDGYDDAGYDGYDDAGYRPRAYRPGRGGFDADAAAAAAHARYSFRQRVALGLIAIAVLSLLAALVVSPVLWWLHVVTDIGLVGYLVFLRRQTRIEDEVRRRRLARLTGERRALEARHERQVEHEARLADVDRWGSADDLDDDGYDHPADDADASDDEDPDDDVDVPAPRWIAPRSPAPEVPEGMELVADTDEDPAFHDLSDSRVPAYRRIAAGA